MVMEIPLTRGHVALIDEEDLPLVAQYKWSATSCHGKRTYAQASALKPDGTRTIVLMHRLIMENPHKLDVDHINGNGCDNRRSNLRACTRSQNNMNRIRIARHNKSGIHGVSFCNKKKKWVARIRAEGQYKGLGYYNTKEEAAAARRQAEIKYFKEFAPVENGQQH